MKKYIIAICLIIFPVLVYAGVPPPWMGATSVVGAYTVATLPAAPSDGDLAIVTDGADAADCTVGGITTVNLCVYDAGGTAWVIVGDGAGSGNAFTTWDVTTGSAGTSPVASGADTVTWYDTAPIVITGSSAADSMTVSITDASTSAKGAAQFSSADFDAAAGVISIADDSIVNAYMDWADIDNLGDEGLLTVADTTDTTSFVGLFESATGDLAAKTDLGLTYNAGTGVLTATGFSGPITGAVTGNADSATLAATVTIAYNENTNENNAVVFLPGGDLDGGDLALESDGTFYYNPSTGTVTATGFVGALTGNVTGNASGTAATVTGAAPASSLEARCSPFARTRAEPRIPVKEIAAILLSGSKAGRRAVVLKTA